MQNEYSGATTQALLDGVIKICSIQNCSKLIARNTVHVINSDSINLYSNSVLYSENIIVPITSRVFFWKVLVRLAAINNHDTSLVTLYWL